MSGTPNPPVVPTVARPAKRCRRCRINRVEPYTATLIDEGVYCPGCAEELEEREYEKCLDEQGWDHD